MGVRRERRVGVMRERQRYRERMRRVCEEREEREEKECMRRE